MVKAPGVGSVLKGAASTTPTSRDTRLPRQSDHQLNLACERLHLPPTLPPYGEEKSGGRCPICMIQKVFRHSLDTFITWDKRPRSQGQRIGRHCDDDARRCATRNLQVSFEVRTLARSATRLFTVHLRLDLPTARFTT